MKICHRKDEINLPVFKSSFKSKTLLSCQTLWSISCRYRDITALSHRETFVTVARWQIVTVSALCLNPVWKSECVPGSFCSPAHGFHPVALVRNHHAWDAVSTEESLTNWVKLAALSQRFLLPSRASASLFFFFPPLSLCFFSTPPWFWSEHNVVRSDLTPWQFSFFPKSCEDAEERWAYAAVCAHHETVSFFFFFNHFRLLCQWVRGCYNRNKLSRSEFLA